MACSLPPVWTNDVVAETAAPLAGEQRSDVVVIGAGVSGLVAALELAEAGLSVVVLDAARPGSGASGANVGQVGPLFYGAGKAPARAAATLRSDMAERLHRQVAASGRWLFDRIRALGVDCELRESYTCVYRSARSLDRAAATFARWQPYGGSWDRLDRAAVRQIVASDRYVGGIRLAEGGFLDPAKLVSGLATAARRAGIEVHENSPVDTLRRNEARWQVETSSGSIDADQVLVTTGASAPRFWPELARCFYPMPCSVAATGPLPDRGISFLPRGGPIADLDDKAVFAPAITGDGRLLISYLGSDSGAAAARRRFARAFPETALPPFQAFSTGLLGLTPDGLPRLMRREDGLLAVAGCNGFGLTLGLTAAREAARLMLGVSPCELSLPVTAPKPLPAARLMPFLLRNVVAPLANRLGA